MGKPNYEKPSSQVDLEARQAKDYVPPSQLRQGEYSGLSENGYIGVDPIYQNYANDTEKPLQAEKGPEQKIEENFLADELDVESAATPQGEADAEPQEEQSGQPTTTAGGAGATPPTGGNTPATGTNK